VNTAIICILLAGFGQTTREYDRGALAAVWRLSFAAGLAPLAGMAAYRLLCARESALWARGGERPQARRRSARARPLLACGRGGKAHGMCLLQDLLPPRQQGRAAVQAAWRERRLLVRHYWHRLLGTAGAWFLWCAAGGRSGAPPA
jgi:hypothetical protein